MAEDIPQNKAMARKDDMKRGKPARPASTAADREKPLHHLNVATSQNGTAYPMTVVAIAGCDAFATVLWFGASKVRTSRS